MELSTSTSDFPYYLDMLQSYGDLPAALPFTEELPPSPLPPLDMNDKWANLSEDIKLPARMLPDSPTAVDHTRSIHAPVLCLDAHEPKVSERELKAETQPAATLTEHEIKYKADVRRRQRLYEKKYRERQRSRLDHLRNECDRLDHLYQRLAQVYGESTRLSELLHLSRRLEGPELHTYLANNSKELGEKCSRLIQEAKAATAEPSTVV